MVMRALVIPTLINPQDLVPSGQISVWAGLIANIPAGWFLCDGDNSTPDLRDRFIVGAADATEAGATGGSNTHSHDNHAVTQPAVHAALGTHQHATDLVPPTGALISATVNAFGTSGNVAAERNLDNGAATDTNGRSLTEAISGGTPDAHVDTAVDAHNTANSIPVFFVCLYIMKA